MTGLVFEAEAFEDVPRSAYARPYTVSFGIPTGLWVAQATHSWEEEEQRDPRDEDGVNDWYRSTINEYEIIGAKPQRIRLRKWSQPDRGGDPYYRYLYGGSEVLLVGREPFGVISYQKINNVRSEGRYFTCARVMVNGHLGSKPDIARPRFAREAQELPATWADGRPVRNRDRKRGPIGWARLSELATYVSRNPENVLLDFFPFTDSKSPELHVRFARERSEIHGVLLPKEDIVVYTAYTIRDLLQVDPATVWVRAGFATAVLYLHHFGYHPDWMKKAA